jgi:hypothetical protein
MLRGFALLFASACCAHAFNETNSTYNETNSTNNETSTSNETVYNNTNLSFVNVTFLAEFNIENATYDTVCNNADFYVNLVCDCLRTSNPEFSYKCVADAINGIPCINGNCSCTQTQSRRLLRAMSSMASVVVAQSKGPVKPDADARRIENSPPGVSNITTSNIGTAEGPSGVIIGSVVGGVVGFICLVILFYYLYSKCKRDPRGTFSRVEDPNKIKHTITKPST